MVQSDRELRCGVLGNVRRPATVARQQDGEENKERGQNVQDQHRSTDHRLLTDTRMYGGVGWRENWSDVLKERKKIKEKVWKEKKQGTDKMKDK